MTRLPSAVSHILNLTRLLRCAGFGIAPEQIIAFLHAITLLGPHSMQDILRAAHVTLAPPHERIAEFDALFQAWAHGENFEIPTSDDTDQPDNSGGGPDTPVQHTPEPVEGGELASGTEQLGHRHFTTHDILSNKLAKSLAAALPVRHSFRHIPSHSRGKLDLRRALRTIVSADGDIPFLAKRRRAVVQRKLLLLIDISGSMKLHTEDHLRLAHRIVRTASSVEVFTLGTRLTRVTHCLRIKQPAMALARVATAVADWDGGTRIGPALLALLNIPRFAAFARGACVVLVSDGLERGSHSEFFTATRRLSLRAFRLSLCTPLAADPRFSPQTGAVAAILPFLSDLVDGSSFSRIADFVMSLARTTPAASIIWRKAT